MLNYDAMCPQCEHVQEYSSTYEDRYSTPVCVICDTDMELCWVKSAYVRPESMYGEGTVVSRGRRTLINDCDDPWESVPGLCAEMSEEYVAKGKELRWGV